MRAMLRSVLLLFASVALVAAQRPSKEEYEAKKAADAEAKAAADAKEAKMAAVNKVVTMLEDLQAQVMGEGEEEAASYNKFACFCKDTTKEKSDAIKKGNDEKAALEASIAELSADRDDMDDAIETLEKDIEKAEGEMKAAEAARSAELAEYEKNEADLAGALVGLKGAIKVLKSSAEPSLVQFQAVEKTVKSATLLADALNLGGDATKRSVAMFLQQPQNEVPMENYKFHSGDIISSLEGLLDSFRKEKAEVDAEEVKAAAAHDMFMQEKSDYVKAKTLKMEQTKKKKSETKEQIAADSEELSTTSAELLDNQQYLTQLAKMCSDKAKTWDQRSKVRQDELSALTAAITIVKEGVASKTTAAAVRFAQQGVSVRLAMNVADDKNAMQALEAEAEAEDAGTGPIGFLQRRSLRAVAEPHDVAADGRQLVMNLLSEKGVKLKSTLLTSLATQIKAASGADPLAKVKTLIQELIERLLQEAANEANQKGWCDKAMADAKQKRDYAAEEIADLNGQLAEGEASRDQLTEDLAVLEEEIAELKSKQEEAEKNRSEEKAENAQTISDASAGLSAVSSAIEVLEKFYKKAAKGASLVQQSPLDDAPDAGFDNGEAYTGAQGASGGIVGMLDVIKSDFERTISATEKAEAAAAKDHLDFMTETGMSLAEKTTVEKEKKKYLDDTNEKLEQNSDRLDDETEVLKSSLKELMELKPQCIDTGMSYEERVARREEEIEALKKADCILDNFAEYGPNGVADQC